MAITTNQIFPSARYVTTDGLGDLQETTSVPAVASSLTFDGLTFTAVTAGDAGDLISVELLELQAVTGVEVSVVGTDITISTENAASTYTQGDVETAYDLVTDATDLADISVANAGGSLTSTQVQTNLSGGADEIAGTLSANKIYLCIDQDDLYNLETPEQADGRKLCWGMIKSASNAFNSFGQPASLNISEGTIQALDNDTLRQIFTVTAKYAIGGLDLEDEA
jgi:hypothetical protein